MKAELRLTEITVQTAETNPASPLPDLLGHAFLNADLDEDLSPEDSAKIQVGYGRIRSAFPYTQEDAYSRKTVTRNIPAAVLENDFLKAIFLPSLGGRLWSLTDRKSGREILYTNDVIRYSNLAVRNAWFSGGVEWNIGIIGHSPYTADRMFTARLELPDGTPVLRMYNFERIRGLVYQMDFWLGVNDRFLNCRMRVENTENREVPMYWWSNMAVPEYHGGHTEVPAEHAFTAVKGTVTKVSIPCVNGTDVTYYENIPKSADYFFDIPDGRTRYIADIAPDGRGMLQLSSSRLKSRKLFSWGRLPGGNHWQEYLTDHAGRYVEIQAGINQTQYGCIPMPGREVWEWTELYGAYDAAQCGSSVRDFAERTAAEKDPERMISETAGMAVTRGETIFFGNEYAALARCLGTSSGRCSFPGHLDFGTVNRLAGWKKFMETGILFQPEPETQPDAFFCEPEITEQLKRKYETEMNRNNWYAAYQTGLVLIREKRYEEAERCLFSSVRLSPSAWAYHALACVQVLTGRQEAAAETMRTGLGLCSGNLSYVKEGFRILDMTGAYDGLLAAFDHLPEYIRTDGRIRLYRVLALHETGCDREAYALLTEGTGLVPDDIREGEDILGELYLKLSGAAGAEEPLPYRFDFKAN